MRARWIFVVLLVGCIGNRPAQADLLFNLNPAGLSSISGSTLTFNGTLANIGTEEIFLNGVTSSIIGDGLSLDNGPFFDNFPFSLMPSESVTADILRVTTDPSVTPGDYVGSITVQGGANEFAQDELATQNFLVAIVPTAVPEPGALSLLLGLAYPGVFLAFRRRFAR